MHPSKGMHYYSAKVCAQPWGCNTTQPKGCTKSRGCTTT
jgi:hypothetical protein